MFLFFCLCFCLFILDASLLVFLLFLLLLYFLGLLFCGTCVARQHAYAPVAATFTPQIQYLHFLCYFLVVSIGNNIVVVVNALGHIKIQLVRQSVIGTSVLALKLLPW